MVRKKKSKAHGRRGDEQENMVPGAESAVKDTSKRPPQGQNPKDDAQQPPAKKAKTNHPRQLPNAEFAPSSLPTEAINPTKEAKGSEILSKQPTEEIPGEVQHLVSKYDFTPMSIISSSKMEHKIRNVLERISKFSFTNVTGKPGVVILHAQAKNASKMITIAEVAKREVEKGKGKWWQYNKLEGHVLEMKIRPTKPRLESGAKTLAMWEAEQAKGTNADASADVEMGDSLAESNTNDEIEDSGGVSIVQGKEDGEEEAEEVFETMTVPATDPRMTGVLESGRKKVRAVPLMTIYLAMVPVPGLKELYGEQTNCPAP